MDGDGEAGGAAPAGPEAQAPGPSAAEMRRLRARFAAGVTVVTMRTPEGLRGVTVSNFAVVSLSPPRVAVAIEHGLESEALLTAAGAFGVSILSNRQELLAERFAGRAFLVDGEFTGVPYHTRVTGAPLLDDAMAWFDCRLEQHLDVGDHTLFIARVVAAAGASNPAPPLLYYDRYYASIDNPRRP
ncbi:MAG TPA: flavin reductase family protein [Chloroflexota bacterium]|jgi:flavin reductase (DIM6/NTAB) family NADH-FMN oxidoreductase RutF|nr:flavin reductase family protein [Chloroflexota bacterium]